MRKIFLVKMMIVAALSCNIAFAYTCDDAEVVGELKNQIIDRQVKMGYELEKPNMSLEQYKEEALKLFDENNLRKMDLSEEDINVIMGANPWNVEITNIQSLGNSCVADIIMPDADNNAKVYYEINPIKIINIQGL